MMKKMMFLAATSLLMMACSTADEPLPNGTNDEGAIVFELSAVNKLVDGMTRTPVYSQEPSQHVTRVNVYAFKSNGTDYLYAQTYTIDGWTDGTTLKRYAVDDAHKLPVGNYKFLAVGRDASDLFTITSPVLDTTLFEEMAATITASGNESEIFSGWTSAEVLDKGGSRVAIQMTRKVAGVLGYFKNVPQSLNGTTVTRLRLVASNSNQQVSLTSGAGLNTTPASFDVINVDMSTQTVSNGVYTGNILSGQGVVKLPNSQLGGLFFLPVSGITLTLGLYDSSGNAVKTWVVKDSSNGAALFDIQANHFYSLGKKSQVGNITGGTPDPGDDDAAIDLLTDQNIVITISPAWELIHNLVIQ